MKNYVYSLLSFVIILGCNQNSNVCNSEAKTAYLLNKAPSCFVGKKRKLLSQNEIVQICLELKKSKPIKEIVSTKLNSGYISYNEKNNIFF